MSLKLVFFFLVCVYHFAGQAQNDPDVIQYDVSISLDMEKQSLAGQVSITFLAKDDQRKVVFDCGDLRVKSVEGISVKNFRQEKNQLILNLSEQTSDSIHVDIDYSGQPKRGLIFQEGLAYTVFSTDQWMICNMDPADRARINLAIKTPDTLQVIANGSKQSSIKEDSYITHFWQQDFETPAYTFGLTVGSFLKHSESKNGIDFSYYSSKYSREKLEHIFKETQEILSFLERKSGVPFNQKNYSQVLAGDLYQEMSGFSMIKESYGNLVLEDSTETNLITHELAHQWWGNMITCESWSHFWLNEGFATFMSAAYNQFRFGEKKYQSDISSYKNVYLEIRERGNDKSLIFESWDVPSRDDRNIVYFKGAYVLHLLRKEMGEEAFWQGIKTYFVENFGKSVDTRIFQNSMEKTSKRSLDDFFNKWVY